MKKIILKNNQELLLTSPKIEEAKFLADFANIIKMETRFVSSDIADGLSTEEGQIKWINANSPENKGKIVVAKIDGEIVGTGNISPKSSRVRYRHICQIGISVKRKFWGLGIASQIMEELIIFAKNACYEQIELDVVSTNVSAIHLYKKFGFIEEGRLTHAMKYTDGTYADFIKMQKFL